jgi:hypothetical protein
MGVNLNNKVSKFVVIPPENLLPSMDCQKYIGLKRILYSKPQFQGETITSVDKQINFNWQQAIEDPSFNNSFDNNDLDSEIELIEGKKPKIFSIKWFGVIRPDITAEYKIRLHFKGIKKENHIILLFQDKPEEKTFIVKMEEGMQYNIAVYCPDVAVGTFMALKWKIL